MKEQKKNFIIIVTFLIGILVLILILDVYTRNNWNSIRRFDSVCNSEKCVDFTQKGTWSQTSRYIVMDMCWNEITKYKICERRNFDEYKEFEILCEGNEWYDRNRCIEDSVISVKVRK